jgi:hypothetical protein
MAVHAPVSAEEYLETVYHPDCDYIDGEVSERNVGELSHGRLQGNVFMWFRVREQTLRVK